MSLQKNRILSILALRNSTVTLSPTIFPLILPVLLKDNGDKKTPLEIGKNQLTTQFWWWKFLKGTFSRFTKASRVQESKNYIITSILIDNASLFGVVASHSLWIRSTVLFFFISSQFRVDFAKNWWFSFWSKNTSVFWIEACQN